MNQTSTFLTPVARPTRTAAFTLIELLTVIAIIGILAAILIPTIASVRATTHQSSCSGNLRQIALATLTYAGENRGQLPGARTVNSSGVESWTSMYRAIRNPGVNTVNFADEASVASSRQYATQIAGFLDTTKESTLWRCPGNAAGIETSLSSSSANETTYLLNQRTNTNRQLFFGGVNIPPVRLIEINAAAGAGAVGVTSSGKAWSAVTDLNQIWMISDLDSINYAEGVFAGAQVPMPHKGGRNYAFFDGHVEHRKADNLPANP
jgi:prepilin-type processing-associated H-X9-DG protein/prepilin-type N-terminal cleavage/methylation domain-containing protein